MSRETLEEDIQTALDRAIVNDVDPDDIEDVLDEATDRVDKIRAMRGDA